MYVEPITRKTFEHANQVPFENIPQIVIALYTDIDQYYVFTPDPIKKDPPQLSDPNIFIVRLTQTPSLTQKQAFIHKKNLNIFENVFLPISIFWEKR